MVYVNTIMPVEVFDIWFVKQRYKHNNTKL